MRPEQRATFRANIFRAPHFLEGESDERVYQVKQILDQECLERTTFLQQEVFGLSDWDVFPTHMLLTLIRIGGFVLGSFDATGDLVGFAYFFPMNSRSSALWLDMIGVRADRRDQGIGLKMMESGAQQARTQGIDQILCTYDPLEPRNANLYLRKLGAEVEDYLEDPYGGGFSGDRFLIKWDLGNKSHLFRDGELVITQAVLDQLPRANLAGVTDSKVRFPLPPNLSKIPAEDELKWRQLMRETLPLYLSQGYRVEFVSWFDGDERVNSYLLRRDGGEDG
jgi:predicted GNAT superfamily acetyltransferase